LDKQETILVVDDNRDNVEILQRLPRVARLPRRGGEDGKTALAKLEEVSRRWCCST
jgi:CheY-like chemotaxis protein